MSQKAQAILCAEVQAWPSAADCVWHVVSEIGVKADRHCASCVLAGELIYRLPVMMQ